MLLRGTLSPMQELGFRFCFEGARLYSLRKNSVVHPILGGAAVYRCDNWRVFSIGFSRWGDTEQEDHHDSHFNPVH